VATVLFATFTAPYRIVGKPPRSTSCANQIEVPSYEGGKRTLPPDGSSVALVSGWLARRVGALNGLEIVACRASEAPAPPLSLSR
jgi:hypothetical protein